MTDIKALLDAINAALSIVKTVAGTPGVSALPYASTIASAIGSLQSAYSAGQSIVPYVAAITDTFSGGVPTQAQLDALDARIAELEGLVGQPLPPKEAGEPD